MKVFEEYQEFFDATEAVCASRTAYDCGNYWPDADLLRGRHAIPCLSAPGTQYYQGYNCSGPAVASVVGLATKACPHPVRRRPALRAELHESRRNRMPGSRRSDLEVRLTLIKGAMELVTGSAAAASSFWPSERNDVPSSKADWCTQVRELAAVVSATKPELPLLRYVTDFETPYRSSK